MGTGCKFNRELKDFNKLGKEKIRKARKACGTAERHKLAVKLQARSNSGKKQRLLNQRGKTIQQRAEAEVVEEDAAMEMVAVGGAASPAVEPAPPSKVARRMAKKTAVKMAKKANKGSKMQM